MATEIETILTGNLKFGPSAGSVTDYSDAVFSAKIKRTRKTVTIPATFATGREDQAAGARAEVIELSYANDLAAASFWLDLWTAFDTPDGFVYFEGSFRPGAVSPTNPKFSGKFIVTGVSVGGASGEIHMDQQSFPITGGITKATA